VMWWEGSEMLDTFVDISATWSASFFVVAPQIRNGYLVRLGRIFVSGKGEKGELGLGKNTIETAKPREVAVFGSESLPEYSVDSKNIPLIPGILAGIWSSVTYTVTCSTDGVHVFGWGNCRKGQLGQSAKEDKVVWEPRKVPIEDIKPNVEVDRIFMAAVGKDFTLLQGSHGRQESRVRKWKLLGGNDLLKNDGDDMKRFLAELTIPVPSGEMVWLRTTPFASWSNVYVLESRTNQVKALGRDDYGQLPPEELPKVWTMAAGSEHCVAVTLQGRVVIWGWGEHGNCGRKSDETGQGWSVPSLPIADTHSVAGVGAGCATTFIWTAGR
jgi:protein ATS1